VAEPLREEAGGDRASAKPAEAVGLRAASNRGFERNPTGWGEIDRVLGGGIVDGSVLLLGGEPGVGKSTLLLQMAGAMARSGESILLASAEESADQVALRAERLGIGDDLISLVSDEDVDAIVALAQRERPRMLIVDSIQTVGVREIGSAPGGVAQVRESAGRLVRLAKTTGIAVVLVGHVTKDGGLAGPKMLEHMVDVVLYLEGDPDRGLRVLRSNKNRFGATHVSGMFDMRSEGLAEVDDPSKVFLEGWEPDVPGTVIYPAVEGRRSILVEIQALVSKTNQAQPRRSIRGLDPTRVNQVLAVLDRHGSVKLHKKEVYVNVVGGWRLDEPGCDLAIALAVASSHSNQPLGRLAAWGEIGLAGEVRGIPMETRRIEELDRMGLEERIAPIGGKALRLRHALERAGLASPG
jgi:DNA repair protein RadA/Sms